MGFSVSGSFAIILVASIVAFGMFYTATANTSELLNEANQVSADDRVAATNTEIEIGNASIDAGTLTISVNNTGTTTLSLNDTDVIVDGTYQLRPFQTETVEGESTTALWKPGDELRIEIGATNGATRVKIVTEHGIADAEEI